MVLQKLQLLSVACPLCRLDVRETFSAEAGCARGPAAAPRFAFGRDRPVLQSVRRAFGQHARFERYFPSARRMPRLISVMALGSCEFDMLRQPEGRPRMQKRLSGF